MKKWERMDVVIGNNMHGIRGAEIHCHIYVIGIPPDCGQEFQPFSLMPNETLEFPTLVASVRRGDKFGYLFSTAYMKDMYFVLGPIRFLQLRCAITVLLASIGCRVVVLL